MTDIPPHEVRFQKHAVNLTRIVGDIAADVNKRLTKEKGKKIVIVDDNVVNFVAGFIDRMEPEKLLVNFIEKSYKYWDNILNKEDSFFEKNSLEVFGDLPETEIKKFQTLFNLRYSSGERYMCKEDQESIWSHFEAFIKTAIKFIHDKRGPYLELNNETGDKVPKYRNEYMKNITIKPYAIRLQMKLKFESCT